MHEELTKRTKTYRIAKELGGSMIGLARDQWARLIADCDRDPPTVEEIASKLADRFDLDVERAREQIDEAIESDSPVEYDPDLGIYGGLVVQPDFDQGERDEAVSDTGNADSPKPSTFEEHESNSTLGVTSTGNQDDSESAPNTLSYQTRRTAFSDC